MKPDDTRKMPVEKFYKPMTFVALVATLVSLHFLWPLRGESSKPCWAWLIAGGWAVLPPLWFGFENWQIIKHGHHISPTRLSAIKLHQESAKSIWFGIAGFILLLMN